MNDEISRIIREARRIDKFRSENGPRACFVIDHDYVSVFCDSDMAREYYRHAKQRICLEYYYWLGEDGCQIPFGLKHLTSIIKHFLWQLRWNSPLDYLYCYHFKLMRRRKEAP